MYMNVDIRNYVINFFPQFLPDNITETDKKNNEGPSLRMMHKQNRNELDCPWMCVFVCDSGKKEKKHGNLVDSASSHTLVSKIKPCMSKYKSSTLKLRMAHYISYSLFDSPLLLG